MRIIDAFAFCRNGEQQTGKLRLAELPRLRAECVSDEGEIEWSLVGSIANIENTPTQINNAGFPVLRLTIHGSVQLQCQRCLTPYVFQIQSDESLLFAKDEQEADQLDLLLEGNDMEVIEGSKTFDIIHLIEDEALLVLPLSPRHDACPNGVKFDATSDDDASEEKQTPFGALKNWLGSEKTH